MLDEKRITEAEQNVRDYLQSEMLKKHPFREEIIVVLLNNSKKSIEIAKFLSENNKSNLWIIASSYYSMIYMANKSATKLRTK